MRVHIISAALLLLPAAASLDASEPLSLAVSPTQSVAPTNLTIRIHIEPHDGDRELTVVAESGDFYRSSLIQIDDAEAPRTISFEFRAVPGGDYDVTGTVVNNLGKVRATAHRHVIVIDPSSGD